MNRFLQLAAAWLTLLSLTLSASGIGPSLLVALAEWDGQHGVRLDASDSGINVVLHHHEASVSPSIHRHGVAVRLGLLISCSQDDRQQDHVARFFRVEQGSDGKLSRGCDCPLSHVVVCSNSGLAWNSIAPGAERRPALPADERTCGANPAHLRRGSANLQV